jgi:hypothetical protein
MPHLDIQPGPLTSLTTKMAEVNAGYDSSGIYARLLLSPDLEVAAQEVLSVLRDIYSTVPGAILVLPPKSQTRDLPGVEGRFLSVHMGVLQLREERWPVIPYTLSSPPLNTRRKALPSEFRIQDSHLANLFTYLSKEVLATLCTLEPILSRVQRVRENRFLPEIAMLRLLFAGTMSTPGPPYFFPEALRHLPAILCLGNALSHARHANRLISTSTSAVCDIAADTEAVCCKSLAAARKVKEEPVDQIMDDVEDDVKHEAQAAPTRPAATAETLDDILAEDSVNLSEFDPVGAEDSKPPATVGAESGSPAATDVAGEGADLPMIVSFGESGRKVKFSDAVDTRLFSAHTDGEVGTTAHVAQPTLRTTTQHFFSLGSIKLAHGKERLHNPWVSCHQREVAPGTLELVQVDSPWNWSLPMSLLYALQEVKATDISAGSSVMFLLAKPAELDTKMLEHATPLFSLIGEFDDTSGFLTVAHPTQSEVELDE